jgi:hypothetical protein
VRRLRQPRAPLAPTRHGWTADEAAIRRRLRLLVGVFTGLLWVDNLTEHYRGAFKVRVMWVPIIFNPVAAVAGVAAALSPRARWRRAFLALSAVQALVALVGFASHQRGIMRRVGSGWRTYVFHAWYGPPVFAPLQYLGFSLLGLLATLPHHTVAPLLRVLSLPRLLRLFVAVNVPPLWGEIAYLHWRGSFQDPAQWLPVATIPAAGIASVAATVSDGPMARRAHCGFAWWILVLGVLGTGFHLVGLGRRYGGYSPKALFFNWLSGPPVPAPLQLIGLGLAALIGERARRTS